MGERWLFQCPGVRSEIVFLFKSNLNILVITGEIRGREWGTEDGVPWIGNCLQKLTITNMLFSSFTRVVRQCWNFWAPGSPLPPRTQVIGNGRENLKQKFYQIQLSGCFALTCQVMAWAHIFHQVTKTSWFLSKTSSNGRFFHLPAQKVSQPLL